MDIPPPGKSAANLQGSSPNFVNSNIKSAGVLHAEPPHGFYRVAIVGAASLKGKDVAEVLDQRNFPSSEVKLLDEDEATGQLEAVKDEVTFIQSVRAEQFEGVDFTFFASDADSTRKSWKQVQNSGSTMIDLSAALENEPGAALRAPWVERQVGHIFTPELQPGPAVIAHPAAIVLALLLTRLHAAEPVNRAVASVFQPASEYAQKGMDELHEQTINLLSFQPLPKKIFDAQVAFNLISRYGPEATNTLAAVNERVLRHFEKIARGRSPMPSVLLLQAPVFHGHSFAVNVNFFGPADVAKISAAISGEHVSLIAGADEAPNNVNAAGQGDILVSVAPDPADLNSAWIWAATDNLRVAASSAVEAAESMTASRPRGKIQ
jgi:aspartate-semialdehyde dehydrogenase